MIMAIDPSGSGVTAIFYPKTKNFKVIKNENWLAHLAFIQEETRQNNDNNCKVYLENVKIAYNNKSGDIVPLIKLLGAIESWFSFMGIEWIDVTSDQTKRAIKWFTDVKLLTNEDMHYQRNIKKLEFVKASELINLGTKWYYGGEKISTHQRDTILIYLIGKNKASK